MSILRLGPFLGLLFLAACAFDGSALDDRSPCVSDNDCSAPNSLCVEGSCSPAPISDTGIDQSDTHEDLGLACEPGTRTCEGNNAIVCSQEGVLSTESCEDPAFCDATSCTCSGGFCIRDEDCEPQARRCQGDTILECQNDGAEVVIEECQEPLICDEGDCVEPQCEEGTLSCQGEVLVRCAPNGAGITVADCANSNGYCTEEPEPHCEPRVCDPGAQRCTEDLLAIETCDDRGVQWDEGSACLTEELCNRGTCVPRACEAGTQDCNGVRVFTTCNETGDDSVTDACDEGFFCLDAGDTVSCEAQSCEPGRRLCVEGEETVEICDDLGSGYTSVVECEDNQFCSGGFCSAQVCIPTSLFCVGDFSLADCNDRGSAFETVSCGEGSYCDALGEVAECRPQVCAPDEGRCVDGIYSVIELCDARGAEFVRADCGAFTACTEGECRDVICEGGDVSCPTDFSASTCLESGTGYFAADCPAGTFCDPDIGCADQVCAPDTFFCDGDFVVECDSIGSSAAEVEECDFGCSDGDCRPSICGDGILSIIDGEECDDGNVNGCDGCFDCRVANAGEMNLSTLTTSTSGWEVGNSDVTIEAWVNPSVDGAFFGVGARTGPDYLWAGMQGGAVRFEFGLSSSETVTLVGTANIQSGWHHIAVQRFAAWGAAIYVDGVLDAFTHDFGEATTIDGSGTIWVASDGATSPAVAVIDQVHFAGTRLYTGNFAPTRVLSPNSFTVGLYDFDGEPAGVLTDESTVGNDLSITGLGYVLEACYGDASGSQMCGDSAAADWEECDDGNVLGGDGCDSTCALEVCAGGEIRGPSDQCFWFTDSRQWSSARGVCAANDGDLAILDTELENDWVTFYLGLPSAHWIGVSAISEWADPDWSWVNGAALESGEGNPLWASGEPSDSGCDGWTVDEDCAAVYGADNPGAMGQWNDFCCDTTRPGICER